MTTEDFKRKLTAILSADVVGYSRLMGDDEAATVKTLETYKGVMFSLIKQHRGRVVDSPGDNLLAEFGSVVDAVQCAVSIQKELQTRNTDLPENRRMEFRIGINLGDVIEEEDRIYGDGVNIAARLEALADPGGICVSKTAFDHIESKLPLGYEFLGDQTVKNIAKPVGAYKVLMETRVVDGRTKREAKAASLWRRTAVLCLGIILILVLGGILYWNFYHLGPSIEPASVERMAYPLPDKPSIAVLPFTNMSGDPEQDYIGDGFSENIISALSVSSQIFVTARNSTFTYKGKPVKVQQVAEDLGVQYILEGSIMKSGERLRVTAQLIDALAGHHLWSDVYDREMKELFELLDEVTKKIVVSLQVELTSFGEDARIFAKSTDSLEAWKHYLKGDELFWNFTKEDNKRAQEHFEAALEFDPDYVGGISYLAISHLADRNNGWSESPLASMKLAFELAQKAMKLDDQSADVHGILALVYLYQREHEKAIKEGKRAITLNPNFAFGHGDLATIMVYSGRFDEAIILAKKAFRLNPDLTPIYYWPMAVSYLFLGRYEDALELSDKMEGTAYKEFFFPWLYQELGREEEARAYMTELLKKRPDLSLEMLRNVQPFMNPAHLQRLLNALRKAGMPEKPPGAVQEKPSIAVLPFIDISPEKDQEYFVDGLSEELLNCLAKIPDLRVTARTSSFSFKGTDKKIHEIANELGVAHILEGSVRKAGNALRITAQLIRAADGFHLWSETYDRELKDIFAVQENIATSVADELKVTLGIRKSLKQLGGTENLEAYKLYLIAKGLKSSDVVMTRQALEAINAAIDLDSRFALAWAEKTSIHQRLVGFGPLDNSLVEQDMALNAAMKAIELEPNLAEAYDQLGHVKRARGDWIGAELAYSKARELTSMSTGENFPWFIITVGHFERANNILGAARQIDPLNQRFRMLHILTIGLLSDNKRVDEEIEYVKALFKDQWGPRSYMNMYYRNIWLLSLGVDDSISSDEIVWSDTVSDLVKEHLNSPKEGLVELQRFYTDNESLSSSENIYISLWAAYFGDSEFAMDAMEKGVSIHHGGLFIIWYPAMREVRRTPRFKEFLREIGLVDYWKKFGWPDLCHPVGDDDFVCD